jgi:serine/threonine protein kinase
VREMTSEFIALEVLSGQALTEKTDIFSFTSILFSIVMNSQCGQTDERTITGHPISYSIPQFVYELIKSGLSTNPDEKPTVDEIIDQFKEKDFRITDEIDSENVLDFVNSVKLSKL